MRKLFIPLLCVAMLSVSGAAAEPSSQTRKPKDHAELVTWLRNMVAYHQYTPAEAAEVLGIPEAEVSNHLKKEKIEAGKIPERKKTDALTVLPYPGGRHPRIGFLDGAIDPKRDTKISVFLPWDPLSFVVVDVPEAIFSQYGVMYLAHTHHPTMWDQQGIKLDQVEWQKNPDHTWEMKRTLPNQVSFGTKVTPKSDVVEMEIWLTNNSKETITTMRVQNCVMLKGAKGFNAQTNENKKTMGHVIATKSEDGKRWMITAWSHSIRAWNNPPCPCMHSDPQIPDCAPGETKRVKGWLVFYEGTDIDGEMAKLQELAKNP